MTFERIDKCPACNTKFANAAEMAGHTCPTGNTDQHYAFSEMQARQARANRAKLQPTPQALRSDVETAINQLVAAWDGEIEATLVLTSKRDPTKVVWGTSLKKREDLKTVLRIVKDDSRQMTLLASPTPKVIPEA